MISRLLFRGIVEVIIEKMHRAEGEILNQAIHDFSRTVLGNLALSRANLNIRIYLMVIGHVPVDLDGADMWSNFGR